MLVKSDSVMMISEAGRSGNATTKAGPSTLGGVDKPVS